MPDRARFPAGGAPVLEAWQQVGTAGAAQPSREHRRSIPAQRATRTRWETLAWGGRSRVVMSSCAQAQENFREVFNSRAESRLISRRCSGGAVPSALCRLQRRLFPTAWCTDSPQTPRQPHQVNLARPIGAACVAMHSLPPALPPPPPPAAAQPPGPCAAHQQPAHQPSACFSTALHVYHTLPCRGAPGRAQPQPWRALMRCSASR